jgi:hypothetical protein
MKRLLSILTVASLMTVAAFAVDAGSGTVRLDSAVKVGSTNLPAGNYKVTWTGSGDNAQVTLKQGKYTVTTPAQVVDAKHSKDAFATKTDNGTRVLTEIQFKDKTLVLHDSTAPIAGR